MGCRRWRVGGLGGALFGLILVLTGPSALAQEEGEEVRFQALVNEAVKAREAGDLERTAVMLRQAIDVKPIPEMLNNLGSIYEDLGRYADAVKMYKKVVSDPSADGVLKRLDATRIELLTPKLDRAWLAIDSKKEGLKVFVGGEAVGWSSGEEVPVKPGQAVVELTTPKGTRAQVVFGSYEAGRRSPLKVTLGKTVKKMGRIVFGKSAGRLTTVTLNGYALSTDLATLRTVHLAPGRYVVEAQQSGGSPLIKAVQVSAGETQDLSALLAKTSSAASPQVNVVVSEEGGGFGGSSMKWATIGVGAALAGTGVALVSMANADRDKVTDAEVNGEMTIPMSEAVELEDSANSKGMAGSVLMGLGFAGAAAGVAWLFMDDDAPQTGAKTWVAPTARGLVMGWTF